MRTALEALAVPAEPWKMAALPAQVHAGAVRGCGENASATRAPASLKARRALMSACQCCPAGEEEAAELIPHALPEEQAAALRAQMEVLLREADAGRVAGGADEESAAYGREMWARCEALTAGVGPLKEPARPVCADGTQACDAGSPQHGCHCILSTHCHPGLSFKPPCHYDAAVSHGKGLAGSPPCDMPCSDIPGDRP